MIQSKQAFTLIELLVVVLIIGILAAVALPQYQVAVEKARIARLLPLVDSLVVAQEMYYLSHGTYAMRFADLDIDIPTPSSISAVSGGWGEKAAYADFALQVKSQGGRAYGITGNVEYGVLLSHESGSFADCKRLLLAFSDKPVGLKAALAMGGVYRASNGIYRYYCIP